MTNPLEYWHEYVGYNYRLTNIQAAIGLAQLERFQEIVKKKKIANTNKKIEAAEKQPPAMKGKNKADKKVDINTLSSEEFAALPEETLKRMRGDFG